MITHDRRYRGTATFTEWPCASDGKTMIRHERGGVIIIQIFSSGVVLRIWHEGYIYVRWHQPAYSWRYSVTLARRFLADVLNGKQPAEAGEEA